MFCNSKIANGDGDTQRTLASTNDNVTRDSVGASRGNERTRIVSIPKSEQLTDCSE
jgi:hypothetical protein